MNKLEKIIILRNNIENILKGEQINKYEEKPTKTCAKGSGLKARCFQPYEDVCPYALFKYAYMCLFFRFY